MNLTQCLLMRVHCIFYRMFWLSFQLLVSVGNYQRLVAKLGLPSSVVRENCQYYISIAQKEYSKCLGDTVRTLQLNKTFFGLIPPAGDISIIELHLVKLLDCDFRHHSRR